MNAKPMSQTVTACFLFLLTALWPGIVMSQTAALSAISESASEYGLGRPRAETPQARQTPAPRSEGWWQAFESGWVYWHPRYGAQVVRGKIFETWGGQRWEQGPLGFPTRGESECRVPDSRDRYQVFEGGRIYWRAATNEGIVFNNPTNFGDGGNCSPVGTPGTQRARFRVTLTGFSAHHQTVDNLFNADGWGDEVYIDSNVWTIERTRGVVSHTNRRSIVMGDVSVYPPRVRAGTASARGGIRTGDNVPNAEPWTLSTNKLEDDRLPMRIWEGELVQGANGAENAAIIMPTIWEWDGPDQLARRWDSLVSSSFRPPNISLLSPVIETNLRFGGDSGVGLADAAINLGGLGADRPIGLMYDSFRRSYVFTPQALLLNYQIAEQAISRPYTNNGAGVIEIHYREIQDNGVNANGVTDGNYALFLLIERLP